MRISLVLLLAAAPVFAADPFAALHERLAEAAVIRPPGPDPVSAPKPAPATTPDTAPLILWNVARVESGFNPRARSPKGALGMWQFMPDTARRFGLRVGGAVDERLHPALSQRAAARYLSFLHGLFGDWKLALAGYNAGEGRVRRALERSGARDFDELSRRGLLPLETRLYVPKVLAGVRLDRLAPQILVAPWSVN